MPEQIQEIMSTQLHSVTMDATLQEVAKVMRDQQIGDVLVTKKDGSLCGILTDRDIVVRADAAALPLDKTTAGEICSAQLVQLAPTDTIDDAVKLVRRHAIRRIPVVANGKPVGIVSIGDLARHKDANSALAEVSAAAPNR